MFQDCAYVSPGWREPYLATGITDTCGMGMMAAHAAVSVTHAPQ
jgi:hypothetical protein